MGHESGRSYFWAITAFFRGTLDAGFLLQGRGIGISIGCILGMFPLLIYDYGAKKVESAKTAPKDES